MPNMIASGALLLWPIVALGLFMLMPAARATIWTLLAGYLLLPWLTSFDFAGVPPLDKSSIPNLAALVLAPIMARHGEFRWPRSLTINLLMLLYVLVPFGTAYTNAEPITVGSVSLPGLGFREGLANSVGNLLEIVPFLLGAALLANERSHRYLLWAFTTSALLYSVPILLEIRLAPFLQSWIYNVSLSGGFLQQMRFGGFRAMVFLGHGLLISNFLALALLAAIGLWRMRKQIFGVPAGVAVAFLTVVLLLNKSVGAVMLVALLAPLFLFLRSRRFLAIALGFALLIVAYPFVRGADVLPLRRGVELVRMMSPERAESWEFRLNNEDLLLHRAQEKPWFGWGSYGRNRVLVVTSWGATQDVAVTDGAWVLTRGIYGWLGYVSCFGLLAYPFWRAFRMRRLALPVATLALVAMHLLSLLDLIPNSSLRPITWLIAGALASMTAASLRIVPSRRTEAAPPEPAMAGRPALQN